MRQHEKMKTEPVLSKLIHKVTLPVGSPQRQRVPHFPHLSPTGGQCQISSLFRVYSQLKAMLQGSLVILLNL